MHIVGFWTYNVNPRRQDLADCSRQIFYMHQNHDACPISSERPRQPIRHSRRSLFRASLNRSQVHPSFRRRRRPKHSHTPSIFPSTIPEVTPSAPSETPTTIDLIDSIQLARLPWFVESVMPPEYPTFWTLQQLLLHRRQLQSERESLTTINDIILAVMKKTQRAYPVVLEIRDIYTFVTTCRVYIHWTIHRENGEGILNRDSST